jgi:hypothetical protein
MPLKRTLSSPNVKIGLFIDIGICVCIHERFIYLRHVLLFIKLAGHLPIRLTASVLRESEGSNTVLHTPPFEIIPGQFQPLPITHLQLICLTSVLSWASHHIFLGFVSGLFPVSLRLWLFFIPQLRKMGILSTLNNPDLTPRENEIHALSELFSQACLVGNWSLDPSQNQALSKLRTIHRWNILIPWSKNFHFCHFYTACLV